MSFCHSGLHQSGHAFSSFLPLVQDGLTVRSRRNFIKAGLGGMAGLSVPKLLEQRALASENNKPISSQKSVILLWMTGGPSHIDTWDPKPDRPFNNRGPFSPISTSIPGIAICEHLPKQAAMMDKFTLIRSVDPNKSSHEPNMVFQTGNKAATPRTNRNGRLYPAIGSVCAKYRGPNHPSMPPYVAFKKSSSHIAYGGYLGKQYDPFDGNKATQLPVYTLLGKDTGNVSGADIFRLPGELSQDRLMERRLLMKQLDRIRNDLDQSGSMEARDSYFQQAVEMVIGKRAQQAFDISREPEAERNLYGSHLWCQQALLARRLVESGVNFVTIDLSYHTASGTWDNHGIPGGVYGGISKGLKPILPLFDHILTTLVNDLEKRGLLDDTLVIAMGEFGRTPFMGTQKSIDGRNHWTQIMSMMMAGGGFRHGQVICSSDREGVTIKSRPVTPGDIAATIYHHMQVPLDTTYLDGKGRPTYIVENGSPIREMV